MWPPGTLLDDYDDSLFVIASREVAFGTRGPTYEVTFLCNNRLFTRRITVELSKTFRVIVNV